MYMSDLRWGLTSGNAYLPLHSLKTHHILIANLGE